MAKMQAISNVQVGSSHLARMDRVRSSEGEEHAHIGMLSPDLLLAILRRVPFEDRYYKLFVSRLCSYLDTFLQGSHGTVYPLQERLLPPCLQGLGQATAVAMCVEPGDTGAIVDLRESCDCRADVGLAESSSFSVPSTYLGCRPLPDQEGHRSSCNITFTAGYQGSEADVVRLSSNTNSQECSSISPIKLLGWEKHLPLERSLE